MSYLVTPSCSRTPPLYGPSMSLSTFTCCRAAESMPTKEWRLVWFCVGLLLNEMWHSLVYKYLNFSCRNSKLTCKWQRVTWSRPHVSHNSTWRLVETSKQEVGRAYLLFYISFWGLDSKKKRLQPVTPLTFNALLFLKALHAFCYYCRLAMT